jgi:hypothetical protein
MHPRPDPAQLLNNEPPTRRRLERNLELLTGEPAEKPPHTVPVSRHDNCPADLAGDHVDPPRRDLRSVLIQSHYDRHTGPPQAPWFDHLTNYPRLS